ncbi:MAG: D-glycero-beta-D-manno-heptose 1-phosphate adenylyltransferase [Chitinophagales bacterium]
MNENKILDQIESKIFTKENCGKQIEIWKQQNETIVFTNGCFDWLHRGHIESLTMTSQYADKLVLGLNSDASVKRLKGETRPINSEKQRALLLASFSFIDAIVIFEEDTPLNLIKIVEPNVLIKGGDYEIKNIVGADFVLQNGGKVLTIPFISQTSTTKILQKIGYE